MSAQVFSGREEVNTFALIVLKRAIKLYIQTGMKANRAYTPKNMLAKAGELLGKTYKRGQLQQAHDDLQAKFDEILKERAAE